jgi:hypothetical protein
MFEMYVMYMTFQSLSVFIFLWLVIFTLVCRAASSEVQGSVFADSWNFDI